jgi:hypothetical protein
VATAAFNSSVRVNGTSTSFSNEATTKLTANTRYQITADAKRLIDPAVSVTVEVDADGGGAGGYVTADPSTYTLDRLFGIVTFAADQGASALVRVSGNYLPVLTLAEVAEYQFKASADTLDKTAFGDTAKTKQPGLKDISGSLKLHSLISYDHDPGGGTKRLSDLFDAGTPVLLEISRGGKRFRAWIVLESHEAPGSVADLLETNLNFTGAARGEGAAFGWEP